MHLVQIFTLFPETFLACKLILNVRLLAMLEWLLEFPATVPLPHTLHTLLIVIFIKRISYNASGYLFFYPFHASRFTLHVRLIYYRVYANI
ncbi:MAG: hypothetical protein ACD_11C00029G0037 [uncultured bacterium]|nr:MAG: hypothetical protein ACD_11C00029G0037 [uncultured bacterium]